MIGIGSKLMASEDVFGVSLFCFRRKQYALRRDVKPLGHRNVRWEERCQQGRYWGRKATSELMELLTI